MRIDADPVAVPDRLFEAGRAAIGEDQFDFGMRNAEYLDHVLERRAFGACAENRTLSV